ncbi:hypothetical protein [Bacteroides sp.]|uniref:hypothetical protein n=1 Tax=Bacteroides sp. TaxID=29523 RepID=UPI002FCB6FC0
MKRTEIIAALKEYFGIQELVCKHTYQKFGDRAWQFLDTELLHTLLVLRRDVFKASMIVNNWNQGGSFSQRGLRCNICQLVSDKTKKNSIYLSAHCNGAGVDFDVSGLSAEAARKRIIEHQSLLPYPIRLEEAVTWVHIDIYDLCNGKVINTFKG